MCFFVLIFDADPLMANQRTIYTQFEYVYIQLLIGSHRLMEEWMHFLILDGLQYVSGKDMSLRM